MKYAIADYFSIEARENAATGYYKPRHTWSPMTRRDAANCCPLGRMLRFDQLAPKAIAPGAKGIVNAFAKHGTPAPSIQAAAAFIRNWDYGVLTNLRDALGLEPSP